MTIALCWALAGPAAASLREVAHLRGDLIGPSLVGDEVAWMDQECPDCFIYSRPARYRVLVTGLSAGGRPHRLAGGFTFSSLGLSDDEVDFAVSSTSLAIRRQEFAGGPLGYGATEPRVVRFGARGSHAPKVLDCDAYGEVPYDLDSDRLVYVDPCDEGTQRLFLVDRRTSGRRTIAATEPETPSLYAPRVSGDFVAYGTGTFEAPGAVVRRVRDGAVVYRVSLPSRSTSEGFELDEQGRLAVVTTAPSPNARFCSGTGISWFSPAEPVAHPLPAEPCPSPIRWAGERIVYEDDPDPEGPGTQIRAVGLDSRDALVVDAGGVPLDSFDADARNLAYGLLACDGGTELYVVSLAERVRPQSASCPLALASRTIRVRARRARIKLTCPRGCAGALRIRRRGRSVSGYRFFRQAGRRGVHGVRLTRSGRRLLMARGKIGATLRIRFGGRSLDSDVQKLARRVTLVRAGRARRR